MKKHLLSCSLLALLLLHTVAYGQSSVTWSGAGANNNWSTSGNWTGGTPGGNNVFFNNTDPTTSGTINNIVDQSWTLNALTYANTGTNWQVTEIANGQTLTLDAGTAPTNIFWAGTTSTSSTYVSTTNVKITGGGKLAVNEAGSNFLVSTYAGGTGSGTTANGQTLLDMSGLGELNATVAEFQVGYGRGASAILHLANTNTIKATRISVGQANWTGSSSYQTATSSTMYLGQTNALYTTELLVGSNASGSTAKNANSGTMLFEPGLTGTPTVLIRGMGSTTESPVAVSSMIVGNIGGDNSNGTGGPVTNSSLTDFTGGSVDALVDALTVGQGAPGGASTATGVLKMNQGTFTANTVLAGYSTGNTSIAASTNTVTGRIEVGGGTFNMGTLSLASHRVTNNIVTSGYLAVSGGGVNVTGDIVMGNTSSTTGYSVAEIDLSGGILKVGGNLSDSASASTTSTIKLRGGTLDMDGGNITVDTFTVENGTLKNVNQLNSGGTLTKTTSGTLILDGTNAYSGATVVNGGVLRLSGTHTGAGSYSINDTATLAGTGTLTGATNASVTIASGGTLSPGNSGAGILNLSLSGTGKLSFASGALLSMDAGDRIAFSLAGDWLSVASGAIFNPTGGWQAGVAYTLFDGLTVDPTTVWTLSESAISQGYALDTSFGTDGFLLTGDELQVKFTTIPEPSTVVLFSLCGLLFLLRRKRRAA